MTMESEIVVKKNNEINPVKKSLEPEVIKQEGDSKPVVENLSSPSFISSSSSSSLEFEIGEKALLNDGNTSSGPESVSSPDITIQTPMWSMMTASPRAMQNSSTDLSSVISPDWSIFTSSTPSQMKSPTVQTMGRPAGYDPNRIPAHVFSSKPANATEWSVASNESLFSIHMGNSSFSRDIMFGKSGEVPWLEEWNNSQANLTYVSEAKAPNELSSFPSSLPPVMEVSAHEENSSVRSGRASAMKKEDLFLPKETMERHLSKESLWPKQIVHRPLGSNNGLPDVRSPHHSEGTVHSSSTPRTSSGNPRLSNESGNSSNSFAFPLLLSEGGKGGSMKVAIEKPPVLPPVSRAAAAPPPPKAPDQTNWFSCFSCWPRCC